MAPQVKKAKTAFLYFQGDQLSSIRKELNLSMGDAMSEVSSIAHYCHDIVTALFPVSAPNIHNAHHLLLVVCNSCRLVGRS